MSSNFDVAARNLVRSTIDSSGRLRTIQTLQRSIARVNGRLPTLMATPPTIANIAFAAMPGGWTDFGLTSAPGVSVNVEKFTFVAANWGPLNATFPGYFQWKATPSRGGNGSDPLTSPQDNGRIRFASFAPVMEIGWGDVSSGAHYRLKVDGEYVQTGPMFQPGGGYVRLTWGDGSASFRKLRHYELEALNTKFMAVRAPSIYPPMPWPVEDPLRMIVHGDSMVNQVVDSTAEAARLHGATYDLIANLCGQPDCWNSGVGGTGWLASIGGTRSTFNQRAGVDIIANAPDVIWEMGGKNDTSASGMTQSIVQALVETWLAQVTAALPNVVIFMTGPIASNIGENTSTTFLQVAAAKAAAAAKFPRNVRYIDNLGGQAPWMTGTGRQGTTNGNGISDWAISADGTHPTADGHVLQARRFVSSAITSMREWR